MATMKQPVVIGHLEQDSLGEALNRIVTLIEAMSKEPPEDPIPKITALPDGFALATEDSVFLDDLERFLATISEDTKFKFNDLVLSEEFEVFLKHFLYVVILVSKGQLHYEPETREIWKPPVSKIDST